MINAVTRRSALSLLPACLFAATEAPRRKAALPPQVGEFFRFADPTTETAVVRLTSPETTSLFPSVQNRFVTARSRSLFFSSDRSGSLAPFQVDLKTGALRQLGAPQSLQPHSLSLDTREKLLYFLDGSELKELNLITLRSRTLASDVSSYSLGKAAADIFLVRKMRLERLSATHSPVLAEDVSAAGLVRPTSNGCTFWRGEGNERALWYVPFSTSDREKPKLLAKGNISNPLWSSDGTSLLFLRDIQTSVTLSQLQEVSPESGVERTVASTSQFAAFGANLDNSVFVGASRSKAQPTIVLLLHATRREFTLCEHHSSRPAEVCPVFSPNSQRVYFQSDRDGKPALYSVNVERLIEPTDQG